MFSLIVEENQFVDLVKSRLAFDKNPELTPRSLQWFQVIFGREKKLWVACSKLAGGIGVSVALMKE